MTDQTGRAQGWDTGGYSFSQLLDFAKDGEDSFEEKIKENNTTPLFGRIEAPARQADALQGPMEQIRRACILFLLRWLTGSLSWSRQVKGKELPLYQTDSLQPVPVDLSAKNSFSAEHFYAETESTSFDAKGIVKTSDGRQIDFNLSLSMTRAFCEYTGVRVEQAPMLMTDPLIINIDAPIAQVSDQKFVFDVDADGRKEQISTLSAGSGFLALDQNGDGIINDGSELFGTKSGDGFYDLSRYDHDQNGWIDENDEVFDRLKIWCKGEDGCDVLYTLKEAGVGAICLQNARTDFDLMSGSADGINARIRKTGIFLYENGGVGTMQHLDLAQ
ncbi:MAG: hypothetical protein K6E18_05890 [Lachnospiraceae bacterium]|nr:hypothetical protein [Lachnospiraceae bacterium]